MTYIRVDGKVKSRTRALKPFLLTGVFDMKRKVTQTDSNVLDVTVLQVHQREERGLVPHEA